MFFSERQLGSLALTLSSLAWAGNAIVGRMVRLDLDPLTLSFYRWLITTLILGCIWHRDFRRDIGHYRQHWAFILFGALFGMALFHTLQYQALAVTSAINVTLMTCFAPSVVAIISVAWIREPMGVRQATGIALSTFGAVLIVTQGSIDIFKGLRIATGEAIMGAAVICWATYTIAIRRRPPALGSRSALFAMSLVATALLAPGYLLEVSQGRGTLHSLADFATVAYLGLIASFLAYVAHSYGLERIGAAAASQYLCLIPIFASALSAFFLAEPVVFHQIVALGLIVSGIYWSQTAETRRMQ